MKGMFGKPFWPKPWHNVIFIYPVQDLVRCRKISKRQCSPSRLWRVRNSLRKAWVPPRVVDTSEMTRWERCAEPSPGRSELLEARLKSNSAPWTKSESKKRDAHDFRKQVFFRVIFFISSWLRWFWQVNRKFQSRNWDMVTHFYNITVFTRDGFSSPSFALIN